MEMTRDEVKEMVRDGMAEVVWEGARGDWVEMRSENGERFTVVFED